MLSYLLIAAAAFAAGVINSLAGGGTLISFPTMVWLGRPPIMANATNAVALWPGSLSAMFGYREDLGRGFVRGAVVAIGLTMTIALFLKNAG